MPCVICGRATEGLLCSACVPSILEKHSIALKGEMPPKETKGVELSDEYRHNHFQEVLDYARKEKKGVETHELPLDKEDIRAYNVGESDYSKHKIQPWDLWIEYKLNPFDADIVKRVLRHKKTDSRKMDYEKIIHICKERIRQIETGNDPWSAENVKD